MTLIYYTVYTDIVSEKRNLAKAATEKMPGRTRLVPDCTLGAV